MEDSFRVKVDKIFGTLSSCSFSASSSSSPSTFWGPSPYQFDWNRILPDDLSEDGDQGPSNVSHNHKRYNGEEWREIKTSIGMDSTLDSEEEEDENDIVASGQQLYGYTDHHVNDDDHYETEWEELLEDDEAVEKSISLHALSSDGGGGLKPTLKRKGNEADSSSQLHKRVRFSSDDKDSVMEISCGIPDYVRNPSKYTRYTFDQGEEVDDESNLKAYMNFLNMLRSRDEHELSLESTPRSVAFVPKRKPMAESKIDKGTSGTRDTIEDSDGSAMEEDERETALYVITRHGRKYRARDKQHQEE